MTGNFNGVQLRNITSRSIATTDRGLTLYSFRIAEWLPALEAMLRLYDSAVLILADETIEGNLVHYSANAQNGYEITIESKSKPS